MSKENIYALYRGDEFIDLGTKKELAIKMNCKPEFIGFLTTPAYRRRRIDNKNKATSNALIAIRIDEDDEKESE